MNTIINAKSNDNEAIINTKNKNLAPKITKNREGPKLTPCRTANTKGTSRMASPTRGPRVAFTLTI